MLDYEYYNWVNPELLQLLPANAQLIVEIGCGAGALAEQYKRINPHGQYVGIELNPEAAQVAAQRLDRVIVGNVEQLDPGSLGIAERTVDCLVYGDVLEHLIDPWLLLRRHTAWLRPEGQVLACIPNIQHWSILVGLLRGKWEYQHMGLLDRTHLRFFTLESILALFAQAGLQVVDVQPRALEGTEWQQLLPLLAPVCKALALDQDRLALQMHAWQYVIKAVYSMPVGNS